MVEAKQDTWLVVSGKSILAVCDSETQAEHAAIEIAKAEPDSLIRIYEQKSSWRAELTVKRT